MHTSLASIRPPTLAHLSDIRVWKGLLVVFDLLLLLLYFVDLISLLPYQVMTLLFSMILAVDPGEDPTFLSLATLILVIPLSSTLVLVLLSLLIMTALSLKRRQGRFALYLLVTITLAALFTYLQYPFPAIILPLLLIGLPPFHKWLVEAYSTSPSLTILSSFVALMFLNTLREAYVSFIPLLLLFGAAMMLIGLFKGGVCKSIPEAYSALHQMVFGLLALLAVASELSGLFGYLLIPCALSLFILYHVHNYFSEAMRGQNILDFGGLSKKLRVEAVCTFATYVIIFGLLSVGAEALMYNGMTKNIEFLPIGCVALFVSAASLAVFFRFYTLIYEGPPRIMISSSIAEKATVAVLSTTNFGAAVIVTFSANVLSWMNMTEPGTSLAVTNLLLLVISVGAALSIVVAKSIRVIKAEPWSTGYGEMKETSRQRGEIFTLWKEILYPLYTIRVPDDEVSKHVGKVHPAILMVILLLVAYYLR